MKRPTTKRLPTKRYCVLAALVATVALGCQSGPMGRLFSSRDNTSFNTPTKRTEQAYAIATQATGENTPAQQDLVNQLARQVQSEPDPLVREAIMQSIASFSAPLAGQVLTAGLNDSDAMVRQRCCQLIGQRGDATSIAALQEAMLNDKDFDVRVAATQAIGRFQSPQAVQALAKALEDRDPALQYAGVQAMRQATGQDLGNDVKAYLAVARGETPPPSTADKDVSIANRLRSWTPF